MLLVRGLNHKTGPVGPRERLAAAGAAEALARLKAAGCAEAVVLSTCNRFEAYAAVEDARAAEASAALGRCLDELAGLALGDSAYSRSGADAILHLFRVASGLDSLVLGEAEILGQVKQAYETARQAGMTGKLTNVLFQRALFVGKKVRSDTGIALGHTSVASVAVDLAERIFGSLRKTEALLLGAGEMAELTSRHLASAKIGRLVVANRTWERACELAGRFQGEAVRWEAFPPLLSAVDIVIGSTGADHAVVSRAMVEAALPARKGRSLFFIDIAMPCDVEESVHALDHVYRYALADLEGVVRENVARRQGQFDAADRLVTAKAEEFAAWERTVGTAEEGTLRHAGRALLPSPGGEP
ncbi:MAG: glutamyl-tRNA reductase [Elusimicrobia bacterium]|nr:glutamyl-tRNA reductase [Elusimicrobiota bacterium]